MTNTIKGVFPSRIFLKNNSSPHKFILEQTKEFHPFPSTLSILTPETVALLPSGIKTAHFFKLHTTSQEIIMSLIKDRGEWILADEEGRPINKLWVQVINPRAVRKIVADKRTPLERKLKIRPCEKASRAILL